MSDSDESNDADPKDVAEPYRPQFNLLPEIKMCSVKLKKINFDALQNEDSNSSNEDLPPLPYLVPSGRSRLKCKKSTEELVEEHESLTRDIRVDNLSSDNIEEKIKRLENVQDNEIEDTSLSPAPVLNEVKIFKIFCVSDILQYFNSGDVTPLQCGYNNNSEDLTEYEKTMLSFNRVELEHILNSFLFSSNINCISDCKSFTTYLLKNLSVHSDVGCIKACYSVLLSILEKHPNAKSLTFSSAEIFMLLFNYGVDIEDFKILSKTPDFWRELDQPKFKYKSFSKIPENWILNFEFILNAVINLINNCEFDAKDLCNIIIYFLWMTLDSAIVKENVFSTIRECICVCLDHVPGDKWSEVMHKVAYTFIYMEFPSLSEKFKNVCHIAAAVPTSSKRSLELRKFVSFLALSYLGKDESSKNCSEEHFAAAVNNASNGFSLSELQSLLQKFVEMDSEFISFGTKFLDICISHLEITDEDLEKLCNILKQSESALKEKAHEAKARFLKIHARLKTRLGKISIYKVAPKDNNNIYPRVKKEVGIDSETVPNLLEHIKVKKEPGLESTPCIIQNSTENIISFSEFDCENDDEELDFDSIDKSVDVHMNDASDIGKTVNSDLRISNNNVNSILNIPQLFRNLSHGISDEKAENNLNSTLDMPQLSGILRHNSSDEKAESTSKNICPSRDNLDMDNFPALETFHSVPTLLDISDVMPSNLIAPNPPKFEAAGSVITPGEISNTLTPKITTVNTPVLKAADFMSASVAISDNMGTPLETDETNYTDSYKIKEEPTDSKLETWKDPLQEPSDHESGLMNSKTICSVNILKQTNSSELADNCISVLSCDLTSISKADNLADTQRVETSTFKSKNQLNPEIVTIDQSVKDVSSADNFVDKSDLIVQSDNCLPDTEFSSEAGNQSNILAKLVAELALPEGTEISPVKTDTDSTVERKSPEPPLQDVTIDRIKMTIIDEEVVFVEEVTTPEKTKDKKSKKHDEVIESNDSELQILLCKPVVRSSKSKNKLKQFHKDKLNRSENNSKSIERIDEEVTFVTEVPKNLVKEKGISLPNTNSTRDDDFSGRTKESKSADIIINSDSSDDDGGIVFVCHVDSPSKSDTSISQNNEAIRKDIETVDTRDKVGLTVDKSIESKSMISDDNDINLCEVSPEASTVPAIENLIPADNDQVSNVLLQAVGPTATDIAEKLISEVEAAMNETILKNFSSLENDLNLSVSQPEQQISSFNQDIGTDNLFENSNMQNETSIKTIMLKENVVDTTCLVEDGILISDDIRDKSHFDKVKEIDTQNNLAKEAGQYVKLEGTSIPKVKNVLKRKSVNMNIENKFLESDCAENDDVINKDVNCVLNNLLKSIVELNKEAADRCINNETHWDKSPPSIEANISSQKSEVENIDAMKEKFLESAIINNENSKDGDEPFQRESLNNFHRLNVLLDSIQDKGTQPKCKIKRKIRTKVSDSKTYSPHKRKSNEFSSPISKIQKHSTNSTTDNGVVGLSDNLYIHKNRTSSSPLKFSPKKYLSPKSLKNNKSANKYFDYKQKRSNYCAFSNSKKKDLLTQTGLNLRNVLREKFPLQSSLNQLAQNSSCAAEICVSSDSDSDVMELYCDPKRYRDKECLIIYESEDQIVLDSD